MRSRACLIVAAVMLLCGAGRASAQNDAGVKTQLEGADEEVRVVQHEDGSHRFVLDTPGGQVTLTPEQFAARVYEEQSRRSWWLVIFNITSPFGLAWVLLGLGGQLLFTGRMVVQIFASEKHRRSVVPISFWWLSLIGASMLLTYFLWRKDLVGVLGQSIGWFIYVRNLHLIYSQRNRVLKKRELSRSHSLDPDSDIDPDAPMN